MVSERAHRLVIATISVTGVGKDLVNTSVIHDTPTWTVVIDPQRGGKIASLRDPSGHEWLAQPAARARPIGPDTVFVDAEMAGWDECAPSIDACEVLGMRIPDHGSLWNRAVVADGDLVRMVDDELGFELQRRISPDGAVLLLEYTATCVREQPFLWAAHPQFSAPPGAAIELPEDIVRVVDVTDGDARIVDRSELPPAPDALPAGGSRKVYLHPADRATSATLRHPGGHALTMSWSDACPYLGIWLDNAQYSREPVVAIEPSTGYYDSLAAATEAGRVAWLQPGRPLSWWVRLEAELTPTPPPRSGPPDAAGGSGIRGS